MEFHFSTVSCKFIFTANLQDLYCKKKNLEKDFHFILGIFMHSFFF